MRGQALGIDVASAHQDADASAPETLPQRTASVEPISSQNRSIQGGVWLRLIATRTPSGRGESPRTSSIECLNPRN